MFPGKNKEDCYNWIIKREPNAVIESLLRYLYVIRIAAYVGLLVKSKIEKEAVLFHPADALR